MIDETKNITIEDLEVLEELIQKIDFQNKLFDSTKKIIDEKKELLIQLVF